MADIQYMDPMGYGKMVSHWHKRLCMLPKMPLQSYYGNAKGIPPMPPFWGNTALIIMLVNPLIRPYLLGGMALGGTIRFPWHCWWFRNPANQLIVPRDPGSPNLRMVSWNRKNTLRFVSVILHPLLIIWQGEPGSLLGGSSHLVNG